MSKLSRLAEGLALAWEESVALKRENERLRLVLECICKRDTDGTYKAADDFLEWLRGEKER